MSSAPAHAVPTATVRIRNFSGTEVSMTVNPEKCKNVADLVENFYAESLVQTFFDHEQLLPPKHRLMWLLCSDEESSENDAPAMDFLAEDAELQLDDSSQDSTNEGPVYQFAVQAARDWQEELEGLVGAKVKDLPDAGSDDIDRRIGRETHERVEKFFQNMTLRDAEDFVFDRAYLIPPPKKVWELRMRNPWRTCTNTLGISLPYCEKTGFDRYSYDVLPRTYESPSWALVRVALKLPLQEWSKHAAEGHFFPLHERERFAERCVSQFLFAKRRSEQDTWGEVEEVLKIALSVSEITAGASAKLILSTFAAANRYSLQYSGWLMSQKIRNRGRGGAAAAARAEATSNRIAKYRSAVSLILRDLHSRGKLRTFCAAVSDHLRVAPLRTEWMTLSDHLAQRARLAQEAPVAGLPQRPALRNVDLRRELEEYGDTIGGQADAAIRVLLLLDVESKNVSPTLSHDFTTVIKGLEEHVAAVKTDVVQVFESIGLAARIRDLLPLLSTTMSWDDCVAHLQRDPPPASRRGLHRRGAQDEDEDQLSESWSDTSDSSSLDSDSDLEELDSDDFSVDSEEEDDLMDELDELLNEDDILEPGQAGETGDAAAAAAAPEDAKKESK
ncbi:unnamed protein product [Amoebophrya sp. A120]|nr:unnamed protein product [Amoebophrya sp. A120]|eukprot:GSA120T00003318001.1